MELTRNEIKRLINKTVRPLGAQIVKNKRLVQLENAITNNDKLDSILKCPELTDYAKVFIISRLGDSESQVFQDLVALCLNSERSDGFFVEFGAAGGRVASNTYLLEKSYGWKGILAEPARTYLQELSENRDCRIDHRCVYSESNKELEFLESKTSMLSTILGFENKDNLAKDRKIKSTYKVETISLMDLLTQHEAPNHIDYISIDTEGSELEILGVFDFTKYNFNFITIEHNSEHQELEIQKLMSQNGYLRILRDISRFDSWYVNQNLDLSRFLMSQGKNAN